MKIFVVNYLIKPLLVKNWPNFLANFIIKTILNPNLHSSCLFLPLFDLILLNLF